jgi:hypothetical protein
VFVPTLRDNSGCAELLANPTPTPNAQWVFVLDQLNTHQSESLVRLGAQQCALPDDLGVNDKHGIFKSMPTRQALLAVPSHRIRFVYTPKHASWRNQIELWVSILMRRLLKHANFTSTDDLRQQILDFIYSIWV